MWKDITDDRPMVCFVYEQRFYFYWMNFQELALKIHQTKENSSSVILTLHLKGELGSVISTSPALSAGDKLTSLTFLSLDIAHASMALYSLTRKVVFQELVARVEV